MMSTWQVVVVQARSVKLLVCNRASHTAATGVFACVLMTEWRFAVMHRL
jgi:hypothetical protein